MAGYLSAAGIESVIQIIQGAYSDICQLIVLPEQSVEHRTCRALKIAKGGGTRTGVLFVAGAHARELINPDLLVNFAYNLCTAYTNGTGLAFGPKTYPASTIKLIVEALDVFVFPLINPDGREYVQTVDPWWRKNRVPNPGSSCLGVDINRNYDFLWSSDIGTSDNACSDTFHGPAAFSEPETRNVRSLLDNFPNIECMIDIHSFSQLILFPWGDDVSQTTDPSMNFRNPAFDGLRGNPGDSVYKEYIDAADLHRFTQVGNRMRDAIRAVRGRVYTVEPSVLLYPTSGSAVDYGYSRHLVDATKRKVFSYTIETATEFQPVFSEALQVMKEVEAGLIEFCNACLCPVESVSLGTGLVGRLDRMRQFRERVVLAHPSGRRYVELLEAHTAEILRLTAADAKLRKMAIGVLQKLADVVAPARGESGPIPPALLKATGDLFKAAGAKASRELKKTLLTLRADLKFFKGQTAEGGLARADAKFTRKR
jgi:murein tripeptide amidase MpaA